MWVTDAETAVSVGSFFDKLWTFLVTIVPALATWFVEREIADTVSIRFTVNQVGRGHMQEAVYVGGRAQADGSSFRQLPRANEITCPVLAACYCNGDLVPDAHGMVDREQLRAVVRKVGCRSNKLVEAITVAAKDERINVFELPGHYEHEVATGIRCSPGSFPQPDVAKFEVLASFADGRQRIYAKELKACSDYFMKNGNRTKTAVIPSSKNMKVIVGFSGLLEAFGREDPRRGRELYLTVEDLRRIFIENQYPEGWDQRIHNWHLGDYLATLASIRTRGCCPCRCLRRRAWRFS